MMGSKTVGLICLTFACLAYAAEEPSEPAAYNFNYAINDPTTGDQKDQQETRDGDNVVGYYRTVDADGMLRTVHYKADAVNGFTAEVVRSPVSGAAAVPVPAVAAKAVVKPVAVPVVTPAPAVVRVPAPSSAVPAVTAPYYFGSAGYPYNYQPYSYNYQPYPYAYSPYSYGAYPYSGSYGYSGQYPSYSGSYGYSGQYPSYSSQYISPVVVRK